VSGLIVSVSRSIGRDAHTTTPSIAIPVNKLIVHAAALKNELLAFAPEPAFCQTAQ
jgi:hypothetical protein